MSAILNQIEKIEQVSYQIRRERREIERRAMISRYYDLIMSLRDMTQEAEEWLARHFAISTTSTSFSTRKQSGEEGRSTNDRFSESPPPNPQQGGGRSLGGGIKKVRGSDAVSGKPKAQSTGGSAIPSLKYIRDSIGYAKKDIGHGAGLTEERVRLINSYAGMVMEEINAIDPDEE